jgi:hypothetical protein
MNQNKSTTQIVRVPRVREYLLEFGGETESTTDSSSLQRVKTLL